MPKYVNVRYSLTKEEAERLQRIQQYLEKKHELTKVSQTAALRFMLRCTEATIFTEAAQ
jgi:hypothetical protein